MNARMRRAAVAVAAGAMAVSLAACGSAKESKGSDDSSSSSAKKGDDIKVGLLLPENKTARYEKFDRPLIEKKIKELTNGKAEVEYNNARQDANLQAQQVDTMITNKVDVLIVDAVDAKAIQNSVKKAVDAGIKVVAYDRLAEGPISAYTSFDNEEVGKTQGEALLKALGGKAGKSSKIVMINARSPTRTPPSSRRARTPSWTARSPSPRSTTPRSGRRTTPTPRWRRRSPRSARARSRASTPRTTAWPAVSSPP